MEIKVTIKELTELIRNLPDDQILEVEIGNGDRCRN